MLKVNGITAELISTRFSLLKYTKNKIPVGYCGYLMIEFKLNNKNGYFDFYVDYIKSKEINKYENKKYHCIPLDNDFEINYLEVFDTNAFYSIGEFSNNMDVIFDNIVNDKIKVKVFIKEKFVSIIFDDYVDMN